MRIVGRSFALTLILATLRGVAPLGGQEGQPRVVTVEDVLAFRSPGSVTLSPDGRWVAWVVTEQDLEEDLQLRDLWVVPADGTGEAVRLTREDGTVSGPAWGPDGSWIAFLSERGEERQVWGIRPDGGEAWPVTRHPGGVGDFALSPDGERIAWTATRETPEADEEREKRLGRALVADSAYADEWSLLWVAPLEEGRAGDAETSTPPGLHVTGIVWSPDGDRLAFAARPSPELRSLFDGAVWVQDASGSDPRRLTEMPGGEAPVAWTPELGLLASATGAVDWTLNTRLWSVPLEEGSGPVSLTDALDENAAYVGVLEGDLLVEAARGAGRGLFRIPLKDGRPGGEPRPLTDAARFYGGFSASRDGSRVAFLAQGPEAAPDVHVSAAASFRPRRLTRINPGAEALDLGHTRLVRWRSRADGEEIEGVLTLPVGYEEGRAAPLLLRIHGGPSGVSTLAWNAADGAYPTQVFAGLGYAVLQPNYRGSTGYGERFRGLNRGDISGRDWVDIDSGVDHLVEEGIADPERLGIMGWSFGGHHTYWGITRTDRFRAASAGAGANDLVSMYSQTDLPEFYRIYLGPAPWEDFDLYEARSAYRFVERVTTPLLIQVGERDERVPAEQSIQFWEAMKTLGKAPVELVIYPGQPHGIRSPRLRRDRMTRNVEWFTRWIPVRE